MKRSETHKFVQYFLCHVLICPVVGLKIAKFEEKKTNGLVFFLVYVITKLGEKIIFVKVIGHTWFYENFDF